MGYSIALSLSLIVIIVGKWYLTICSIITACANTNMKVTGGMWVHALTCTIITWKYYGKWSSARPKLIITLPVLIREKLQLLLYQDLSMIILLCLRATLMPYRCNIMQRIQCITCIYNDESFDFVLFLFAPQLRLYLLTLRGSTMPRRPPVKIRHYCSTTLSFWERNKRARRTSSVEYSGYVGWG